MSRPSRPGVCLENVVNVNCSSFSFHKKEHPVLYAGCDLHKQTISGCVMNPARQSIKRERLRCADETSVRRFFEELGEFEAARVSTTSQLP